MASNLEEIFFSEILENESIIAVILVLMSIPGHIIFLVLIFAINIGFSTWSWLFFGLYLVIGVVQVIFLIPKEGKTGKI